MNEMFDLVHETIEDWTGLDWIGLYERLSGCTNGVPVLWKDTSGNYRE